MAADPLPATLGFLTDAAHLLLSASPETSAHLMLQRNSLMFNNDLDLPEVQRQRVCGCCGHIMIAGLGDVLKLKSRQIARKKRVPGNKQRKVEATRPRSGCRKTLICGKCGRYTNITLPPPARISRRRPKQKSRLPVTTGAADTAIPTTSQSAGAPSVVASSSEAAKSSANASSKKRAKNRKQGLQALLQQQSSNSKSQAGLGLSLEDFMQN